MIYVEHPRGTPDDFLFDPVDVSDHARRIAALVDVSLGERASAARIKDAIRRVR